jgi:hypothetical protein
MVAVSIGIGGVVLPKRIILLEIPPNTKSGECQYSGVINSDAFCADIEVLKKEISVPTILNRFPNFLNCVLLYQTEEHYVFRVI